MLVSKQVMTMPLRKVNTLLEYIQYSVRRKLTLKCLDEDLVERLFSKKHASLLEFNRKPPIQRKVGRMKNIIFAAVLKFT